MKLLSILLVALSLSCWAQVKPFQQYIDYQKFVSLPKEDQREFLLSLMETIAGLEQEAFDQGKMEKFEEHKQKAVQIQKIRELLRALSSNLSIQNAYAGVNNVDARWCSPNTYAALNNKKVAGVSIEQTDPKNCMYGSYRSTMSADGKICVRPACSVNPEFRQEHNLQAAGAGCNYGQMACNQALFGFDQKTKKASCVKLDYPDLSKTNEDGTHYKEVAHNASLACLMEVMAESESDRNKRLNDVADNIIKNKNVAQSFNQLLFLVSNICICGETSFNENKAPNSYLTNVDKSYVQYMNKHRSCNALLNQTSLLTDKIIEKNGQCEQQLLPPKLKEFNDNLVEFRTFSTRADRLIATTRRGNGSYLNPNNVKDRRDAMYFLSANNINDNGSNNGIDKVKSLDALTAASTPLQSMSCPLEFPDPINFRCAITGSAARLENGKVNIRASVTVIGGTRSSGSTNGIQSVAWTLGGRAVADKTEATIVLENQEIAAEGNSLSISASVRMNRSTGNEPIVCEPVDIQIDSGSELTACSIEPVKATLDGDSISIPLKAELIKPQPGNAVVGEITWIYEGKPVPEIKFAKTAETKGPFKFTASIAVAGKDPITCDGTATLDEVPDARTCSIEAKLEAIPDVSDKMKLTAKIKPSAAAEGDTFSWSYEAAKALTTAEISLEIAKPSAAIKISGQLKPKTGDPIACSDGEATLPTEPPVIPVVNKDPQACTLAKNAAAPNEKGEFVVDIALQPKTDGVKDNKVQFGTPFTVDSKSPLAAHGIFKQTKEKQSLKATAEYTDKKDVKFKCELAFDIPAAAAAPTSAAGGMPQMQQMPQLPPPPDIFLQGIR